MSSLEERLVAVISHKLVLLFPTRKKSSSSSSSQVNKKHVPKSYEILKPYLPCIDDLIIYY